MTHDTKSSSVETRLSQGGATDHADVNKVFAGGGEMGALMRTVNWSESAVGPVESWPQSLRTAVSVCLGSKFPMFVWWGGDLTVFYNDAYAPILGPDKHPRFLGRSAKEQWAEVWSTLEPLTDQVIHAETATWFEDFHLYPVMRQGFAEDTYFTFSYSPVRDETGKVGGVFCACQETTKRVLGERRLRNLRELGQRTINSRTVEDAAQLTADVLSANSADLPFSLIYLGDSVVPPTLSLEATTGVALDRRHVPAQLGLEGDPTPLAVTAARALSERNPIVLDAPLEILGPLAQSPWPEPLRRAVILPITSSDQDRPAGVLIVGITPRLPFDEDYQGYLDLVAGQLATAVATATAREEEERRAEALAEIDRAKTAFFSNVSHEFRTPLTLMIGPLEDMLAERAEADPRLEVAHRNSLRLLKLVNTLLDFSRIEAGRIEASYEPTDLSLLTTELASNFRSAIERAGMTISVECEPLPEPVFVDREMWEKIVLNLLSNAFKFTFEGGIVVSLRKVGAAAELEVRDSGIGISAEELPKVFERFHRVRGARGRSYEGSGIGLALVQELARLHGGTVSVVSEVGRGSAFTVRLSFGKDHLPASRIEAARSLTSTGVRTDTFVLEALRWLPESEVAQGGALKRAHAEATRQRILVADDNADLRDYVRRLLEVSYDVEVVEDGVAALEAARARTPDLIISDVMMPKLDGFGLIRELRADPALATVSVMLLSARAGEEAHLEGLSQGADDYLVKPFSARDLLGRVAATLKSEGLRRRVLEQERRFRTFVQASSDVVYSMSPDWREMRYLQGRDFIADTPEPNSSWLDKYIHPDDQERVLAAIENAIAKRSTFELEHRVLRVDGTLGWTFSRAIPILGADGAIDEWLGAASDITARKQAENALREADRRKDEFLATLSHELRNPLAPLRTGLQLMRLQGDRPNPAVQDIMERQVTQLVRLVDDLLEISRITRGLLELRRERIEIATIVRDAVDTSQPLVQAGGHRLDISLPAEQLWLDGDPVRLTQVLGNLLNNAAKYTDDGGVIGVSVKRDGDTAVLSVRDTGCGITAAGLERIFEMFSRELHVKGRSPGGLGIGLTLSRRLVEMHGGSIEARSEGEGRGSEFVVRLPLAGTSARAPTATAAPSVTRLPAIRILVVDDNQDAASTLGALLEALGAEVLVVNDGPSALETFAATNPAVILLDIGMPEMDGYEVAAALRTQFPERHPTIIAVTGHAQPEARRRAHEAGVDHHLIKPVQFETLRELLSSISP